MSKSLVSRASLWYHIPGSFGHIEFPPEVLEYFEQFQQRDRKAKEAGGQIFWEYAPDGHRRVARITGPRPTDKRSRCNYKADHRIEQQEIDEFYEQGVYLLGDWHTHPESIASPSSADIEVIRDIYRKSRNIGEGLLLVIVGTRPVEESLSLSWCTGDIIPVEKIERP